MSTYYAARGHVANHDDASGDVGDARKREAAHARRLTKVNSEKETAKHMRTYIKEAVCKPAEHNPAPGAQREIEFVTSKATWKDRVANCKKYFADKGVDLVVISESSLKRVWASVKGIVEKARKRHGKCDLCSELGLAEEKERNNAAEIANIRHLQAQHDENMAGERFELDDAGAGRRAGRVGRASRSTSVRIMCLLSLLYPHRRWPGLIDHLSVLVQVIGPASTHQGRRPSSWTAPRSATLSS